MYTLHYSHPHSAAAPGGGARLACYLLGPLSGALILLGRRTSMLWSVRFHAWNSILLGALWAAAWLLAESLETVAPSWFSRTVASELQFLLNASFALVWGLQALSAYRGERFVPIPAVHDLASRLAHRSDLVKRLHRA